MGGGDLNLKKSWHPQTLRNVEKVWKAEQKAAAEAKKIEQLRKELQDERAREEMQQFAINQGTIRKKDERLDWMYSAPGQINHEQYLLGKIIDKKVDPLAQNEEKDVLIPVSSLESTSAVTNANDLAAKVREDPLLMIRKKEDEKKKELLHNPVRMKQIQLMLRASMDGKESSKKDKKKKKKKKKEKRRARESSSSESENDKTRGRKKPREISSRQDRRNHEREDRKHEYHDKSFSPQPKHRSVQRHDRVENHRDRKTSTEHHRRQRSRTPPNGIHNKSRSQERQRQRSPNMHRSRSRSKSPQRGVRNSHHSPSSSPARHKKMTHRQRSPLGPPSRDHKTSKNSGETKYRKSHHSREKSPEPMRRKRNSSSDQRNRSPSPVRHKQSKAESPPLKQHQRGSNITRKLDPEELERRRAEMMGNAQWRDEKRKQNVSKYREEEAKEDEEHAKNKQRSADFIQPMKLQSFSSSSTSSIQDRIKRNINSVQRTPAALENFLKK